MKTFLFAMYCIITALLMTSCSNQETMDSSTAENVENVITTQEEQYQFDQLRNDIHIYNMNFSDSHETRGFFSKLFKKSFWKKFVIVLSDAIGGTVGAVFGGGIPGSLAGAGIASGAAGAIIDKTANIDFKIGYGDTHTAAYSGLNPDTTSIVNTYNVAFGGIFINKDSVLFKDEPDGPKFNITMNEDSIGYHHNKVLYTIFADKEKREKYCSMSSEQQAKYIIQELNNDNYLKQFSKKLNYSKDSIIKVTNLVEFIFETAKNAETDDDFFNTLAANPSINSNTIDILREVMIGLMQIDPKEDDGKYAQQITEYIDNSDIPDFAKRQLHYSVVIANASNHLWNIPTGLDKNPEIPHPNPSTDDMK